MSRILYVCDSNQGRSPVSEVFTRQFLDQAGAEDVSVGSAGIKTDEIRARRSRFIANYGMSPEDWVSENGTLPHYRNGELDVALWAASDKVSRVGAPPGYLRAMKGYGLDARFARKASRSVEDVDLSDVDIILTMSEKIKSRVQEVAPGKRVLTLIEYARLDPEEFPNPGVDVDDPFHPKQENVYRTLLGQEHDVRLLEQQLAAAVPSAADLMVLAYHATKRYIAEHAQGQETD